MATRDTVLDRTLRNHVGSNECWPWEGGRDRRGYGIAWRDGKHLGAHRLVYEHLVGAIPAGLTLDHLCQNPSCVNPIHLEPVPLKENIQRYHRLKTHCLRGHELTPDNLIRRTSGWRMCRRCANEASKRYRGRNRGMARYCSRSHAAKSRWT